MSSLIPVIAFICFFSYAAVASWVEARRKEREDYYKSDTLKKIAEGGPGATAALEFLREQEKNAAERHCEEQKNTSLRRREGTKIGGAVNIAIAVGLMIFLHEFLRNQPVYLVGLIPLLVGIALLIYSYFLAPKQ